MTQQDLDNAAGKLVRTSTLTLVGLQEGLPNGLMLVHVTAMRTALDLLEDAMHDTGPTAVARPNSAVAGTLDLVAAAMADRTE